MDDMSIYTVSQHSSLYQMFQIIMPISRYIIPYTKIEDFICITQSYPTVYDLF